MLVEVFMSNGEPKLDRIISGWPVELASGGLSPLVKKSGIIFNETTRNRANGQRA